MKSMLLIADSGASKTSWRLALPSGEVIQAHTQGIHPYFADKTMLLTHLRETLLPQLNTNRFQGKIYFYGTGCSTQANQQWVRELLGNIFPTAEIVVETDMLGAARALCAHLPGIACILGTGSHAALYDGKQIIHYATNLGFWLGDEGSGAYLGKLLVTQYLNQELPPDLHQLFEERYPLTPQEVLYHAYQQPMPARYFATFSQFLHQHLQHPYVYQMVWQSFSKFLDKRVLKLPQATSLPIHCTGSIAFYYADILREVAAAKGLALQQITKEPIEELLLYHVQRWY